MRLLMLLGMRSFFLLTLILAYGTHSTQAQKTTPSATATPPQQGQILLGNECREGYVRPNYPKLRAEYRTNIAKWKALNPRDYTFEYHQFAAPVMYPVTIVTIQGGLFKSAVVKAGETGTPSPTARYTMARRFLATWAAIVQGEKQPCGELEISYDARYGFPNRVYTGIASKFIADGNGEWQIKNFSARP